MGCVDAVIVSIIPARGGSKAIPKKNIIPFLGKPLIEYTIQQSRTSQHVDETFVSTDDDGIADISREAGAKIIERPKELAGDTSSTEEALLHAIDEIDERTRIIVLLQCTSPLRRSQDIDEAIELVKSMDYDSSLSCSKDHRFYWEKEDGSAEPVNYVPSERKRRQDLEPWYQENGSIYVTKKRALRETNSRLSGKIGIHEMPKELSYEMDTPADHRVLESIGENVDFEGKNK
jgi:N-acylneuraminate cytidylyltransferase